MLIRFAFLAFFALPRGLAQDNCLQSTFSVLPEAESHIRCAVALPVPVRYVLAGDPFIRGIMRDENVPDLPSNWLSAAYVRLGPSGEKDLLVVGDKGPLPGANVDPIWVLRPGRAGWTIIVDAAPVLTVEVSRHRTNGYYDLIIGKATAVEAYTGVLLFDGRVYRLARGAWKPIK